MIYNANNCDESTRLRAAESIGRHSYDSTPRLNFNSKPQIRNAGVNGSVSLLRRILPAAAVLFAVGASTIAAPINDNTADNSIHTNKRLISYTMLDSLGPLDSYVYSFYPSSQASAVPASGGVNAIAPTEFAELFRPVKRESGKRSSDNDIPGVLRFGKRADPHEILGNPAGVLRFGKRDDMPGVLRFGKREVPGVLRFGKRAPMGDEMMPGVLRFGKREMSANMPAGVLRFGKKSDDMPGVLRFGRK